MLSHRLLENDRKLPVDLALALLGSTISPLLIARIPAGSAILALYLFAFLLRLRLLLTGFLLLGAVFDPPALILLVALLLLDFPDSGLDHRLEEGLIDAVFFGVALKGDVVQPFGRR